MKTSMKLIITGFLITVSAVIFILIIGKGIEFKQNCSGYLKRAAEANTVEMARGELQKSIKYLEDNNLTSGYTSVLWETPDEDIGFWYQNLKASEKELSEVSEDTSSLEKTNLLMKLRETLLQGGEKGDVITYPKGMSVYPHNGIVGVVSIILILLLIVWFSYIRFD